MIGRTEQMLTYNVTSRLPIWLPLCCATLLFGTTRLQLLYHKENIMARKNQEKNKDLCNIKVITSDVAWEKGYKSLRKDLNFFGRVEKGSSAFVSNPNLKGTNDRYVDDFSSLNKKTKSEIVKKFKNEKRKVVYLIKEEPKKGKK